MIALLYVYTLRYVKADVKVNNEMAATLHTPENQIFRFCQPSSVDLQEDTEHISPSEDASNKVTTTN